MVPKNCTFYCCIGRARFEMEKIEVEEVFSEEKLC
jgi:hypothetical protein